MGRELKGCRFPEVGAVAVAPWRCGAETQLRPRKESSRGVFYRLGGGGSGLALRTVELIVVDPEVFSLTCLVNSADVSEGEATVLP